MRSPNYPAYGLSSAVHMAKKIWEKERGTPVPADVAAKALGYSSLNGPARSSLAAMKKFGLLSEEKHGLKVSQLAIRILHPADEDDRVSASRDAALKADLFKQLSETHLNASDDALKSYLITKMSFSEVGAKIAISAFRDTMEFAKLTDSGYDDQSQPGSGESMDTGSQGVRTDARNSAGNKALRSFSWPLSAETTAKVEIFGNEELTADHIDALAQYLEVAKKLLKAPKN